MREQVVRDSGQRLRTDRVQPCELERVEDLGRRRFPWPETTRNAIVVPPRSEGKPIACRTKSADGSRAGAREDGFGVVGAVERTRARADGFDCLSGESGRHQMLGRAFQARRGPERAALRMFSWILPALRQFNTHTTLVVLRDERALVFVAPVEKRQLKGEADVVEER